LLFRSCALDLTRPQSFELTRPHVVVLENARVVLEKPAVTAASSSALDAFCRGCITS
jgi:hypothetical protein